MYGRNNQPNTLPLILDFHTLGNIQFCLIDDKNQIRALPENATLTFAGSVKMGEISQNILFLSTTYTVSEDNVINFTVDTYTEPFLNQIKKKNTEINVEISIKFEDGHQKLLLRDYAYACPRVYIEGVPPTPVESYYTKDEVDSLITDVKDDIPTKTSELINDSGYITSSQIDLSDYYTKEETNAKLDEKADISSLSVYQPLSGMNVYALKDDIPTKTSELTNDSGFITDESLSAYQPISGMNIYALKSDIPSGGESEFPSDYVSDIDHCYGSVYTVDNYNIINFSRGGNKSQRIINWNFDNLKNNLSIPEYSYSSSYAELYSYSNLDCNNVINIFLLSESYELNTVTYASNQIYFSDMKMFKIYNPNGYTFKFGYLDYDSNNNFGEYDDNSQRWEKELISSNDTGIVTFLIYKVRHQIGNDVMMLNFNGQEWPLYFA